MLKINYIILYMDIKKKMTFEQRLAESGRMLSKFPDRVPVIVTRQPKSDVPDIDKHKYLVPRDLNIGQFVYTIRKRIHLPPEKAIFLFIKNMLPTTSSQISEVYEKHRDEDGFLYITYSGENTFGSGGGGVSGGGGGGGK